MASLLSSPFKPSFPLHLSHSSTSKHLLRLPFHNPTPLLHLSSRHFFLPPRSFNNNNNGNNNVDAPDRIISSLVYFYPFFDGIQYGKYVVTQFAPLQILLQPLVPAIRVFKGFPLNGFLVFVALYFVVVRNGNFSKYVRFNVMQAIVLDVLLIFPDLVTRGWSPSEGFGVDLVMSLDSTVFLFLFVSLVYGSGSCLLGMVPRLPIVAEAAERQIGP